MLALVVLLLGVVASGVADQGSINVTKSQQTSYLNEGIVAVRFYLESRFLIEHSSLY
jgi:hypothetical protein